MKFGLGPLDSLPAKFFAEEFSFEQAEELLGTPADTQRNPFVVKLLPHPRSVARQIELEKLQLELDGPELLAGIALGLVRPAMVDFRPLVAEYGEPVEHPPANRGLCGEYEFTYRNDAFECSLAFEVPHAFAERDRKRVERVTLRRVPLTAGFLEA